jgi:hypothetical protein
MGEFKKYSDGHRVIRGKILNYGKQIHEEYLFDTMNVSIEEVVNGSYPHSKIKFVGDPGHLCLTYVDSDRYPIGSEHLFTVFSEDKKQGLGGCGEVSVAIDKGKVKGVKFRDDKWREYVIDYDKFLKSIKD